MKTILRSYYFDIDNPTQSAAYAALCAKLGARQDAGHFMHASGDYYIDAASGDNGLAVELETEHLFENQWNTAPIAGLSKTGLRVFDWAESYVDNPRIKKGHYLEITAEMVAARKTRHACGYCGHQTNAPAEPFCTECRDSEYLTNDYIENGFTRYAPIGEKRAAMSDAEKAFWLPRYISAKIHGDTARGKARIAAQRRKLLADYETTVRNARIERDGFIWLMDHGLNTNNVIFYNHTGRFSIGWRESLSATERTAFEKAADGFPFPYDFAGARK